MTSPRDTTANREESVFITVEQTHRVRIQLADVDGDKVLAGRSKAVRRVPIIEVTPPSSKR